MKILMIEFVHSRVSEIKIFQRKHKFKEDQNILR